jgi:transcriptional regulator with XRE-family HTH domain
MKLFKQHLQQNCLAAFRRKMGLSQQQLAEHMQLGRSTIGMIEQGRRTIPTSTLLQLAGLEIKLAGITAGDQLKPIDPGPDAVVASCKQHCRRLAVRELNCQEKVDKLNEKLKTMTSLYQKTSEWMKLVQLHIKEAGDDKNVLNTWKKHESTAMRTLNKCSLPSQLLLRHTIDALQQEAELHKNKQQELAALMLPGQVQ